MADDGVVKTDRGRAKKKKTTEKGHLLGIETVDFDSGDYSNIAAAFFVDSIVEATPATVDDGFERLALWCVPSGAAIESKKRKKKRTIRNSRLIELRADGHLWGDHNNEMIA